MQSIQPEHVYNTVLLDNDMARLELESVAGIACLHLPRFTVSVTAFKVYKIIFERLKKELAKEGQVMLLFGVHPEKNAGKRLMRIFKIPFICLKGDLEVYGIWLKPQQR